MSIEERRAATRFQKEPGTDFAVILQPPREQFLAEVRDESLGGLGILLDDPLDFRLGCEVDIVYAGSLMRGIVRHVEPRDNGGFMIGLECSPGIPSRQSEEKLPRHRRGKTD